ncbi:MAG: FecR domain-containing protein [Burkholderiales bacterium]|nr:FecR domain-containing protein [Burkholderiales bacterium]
MPSTQAGRATLVLAASLLGAGLATAQDRVHTVQAGDHLYGLAQRYLDDPNQWPQLQRLNQVRDPRRLTPGMQLVIPAALLRPEPVPARVVHASGSASGRDPAGAARPLAAGDTVPEGSRIDVGDDGFVTLRLADGSTLRLPAGSRARLDELRQAPGGAARSTIGLERGRIDSTVAPLTSPRSRFEVRTPLATGGVRGTTFGVAVADDGSFIGDVREGSVQVQRATTTTAGDSALLRGGEGTRVGADGAAIMVTPLLPAPDLAGLPAVVEDIAFIDLPLPRQADASRWQVRIAADAGLEQVVRNGEFPGSAQARFPGLPDGRYRVAVRAVDARGIPGGESVQALEVNARPEPPLRIEPQGGARVHGEQLRIRCADVPDAIGYVIQLARDAAFTQPQSLAGDAAAARCERTLDMPAPGAYFWRVATVALESGGTRDQGPFSPPVPFTVLALPPVGATPDIDGAGGDTFTIRWTETGAGPWLHQLQIAHDAAFSRLLLDTRLTSPSYQGAALEPGQYHVRVRQIDATTGLEGAWGGRQTFDVPARLLSGDNQPVRSSAGEPVRPGGR